MRVMEGSLALALRAVLEAPGFVSGLDNLTMVRQAVEKCRRHLGIAEHRWPFTEGQVCGDDDRGALVESADQVEQELTSGLSEG